MRDPAVSPMEVTSPLIRGPRIDTGLDGHPLHDTVDQMGFQPLASGTLGAGRWRGRLGSSELGVRTLRAALWLARHPHRACSQAH
jgi:hypothetical protein